MHRSVGAGAVFLGLVSVAAAEERPEATLSYEVNAGLADCPDEQALRDAVAARLGYVPFTDHAGRRVVARIHEAGSVLSAQIEVSDASGAPEAPARTLRSATNDCEELVRAMALSISVAIDPMGIGRTAQPPPVTSAPPPVASAPPPVASAPPRPLDAPPVPADAGTTELRRFELRSGAGAVVAFGAAPDTTFGFLLGVGLRHDWLSVSAEGRINRPADAAAPPGGSVRASLLLGALVPCAHGGVLFGCALAAVGSLRASGSEVDAPRDGSALYAATGVRAGAELRLVGPLSARVHGGVWVPLTPVSLDLGQNEAWSTPALVGDVGLSLLGSTQL